MIVHGAWHQPLHYTNLLNSLQTKGYTIRVPALATAGWDQSVSGRSVSDDVAILKSTMKEYLQVGKELVVVCHSFGGISATASVVGETVPERQARGDTGGVKAVVFLAAFAPPSAGLSLVDIIGIKDESQQPDWWTPVNGLGLLEPKASDLLYSGLDDEIARVNFRATAPQSLQSFHDKSSNASSDIVVPKTYVVTQKDAIIPSEGQKAMANAAGANVIELEYGHSPFLSAEGASSILKIIEQASVSG
ncbi:hypothetical protein V2G26_005776 [Clonostachys chloroleuca]|uniref:AB hydrolase-1 domain-containing protein n=1 Tax=Clonostachys chloroleuca TaxID=1926264 RepID=A0AA35QC64_9HYPO|nr:unnamed protein product [Clonostachys chloroleuca]